MLPTDWTNGTGQALSDVLQKGFVAEQVRSLGFEALFGRIQISMVVIASEPSDLGLRVCSTVVTHHTEFCQALHFSIELFCSALLDSDRALIPFHPCTWAKYCKQYLKLCRVACPLDICSRRLLR